MIWPSWEKTGNLRFINFFFMSIQQRFAACQQAIMKVSKNP
jgi:hypothetical protein